MLLAGRREKLLGEERVALGACDDRVRQRRRQEAVRASRQQLRQLLVLQRLELK